MILVSNLVFYSYFGIQYLFILLFEAILSYFAGIVIEKHQVISKHVYLVSVLIVVGALGVFKYTGFVMNTLVSLGISHSTDTNSYSFLLPVGISFYTFVIISYLTDIYKKKISAEQNLIQYLCFVSFFPTVSSGPIERANRIIPQLKNEKKFDYDTASYSIRLFAWGLFKKAIVADSLAMIVNKVFGDLPAAEGFAMILGIMFYTIHIYCDFSGYSDMARGIAGLLGIDVINNFKNPFFSTTTREFWTRWHISLSTWLRDYVYIPLGGNRKGTIRKRINLIITFLVSGLWHGANWTYVFWGFLNGVVEVLEDILGIKERKKKDFLWVLRVLLTLSTFSFLLIFFRSSSISEAIFFLKHCLTGINNFSEYIYNGYHYLFSDLFRFLVTMLYISVFWIYELICLKGDPIKLLDHKKPALRWIVYVGFGILLIFLMPITKESPFVYFAF